MFTRVTDASKVTLVTLARQLERWRMPLIDCQMSTPHLASLGARDVPRTDFLAEVRYLVQQPVVPAPWRFDL
jgi:leucyl/phenylalanyl-tRNA--protein transferase